MPRREVTATTSHWTMNRKLHHHFFFVHFFFVPHVVVVAARFPVPVRPVRAYLPRAGTGRIEDRERVGVRGRENLGSERGICSGLADQPIHPFVVAFGQGRCG